MSVQTRLEIIKLIHRHDHTPEAIIERAEVLEKWVSDIKPEPAQKESGPFKKGPVKPKVSGNIDPLS